MSFAPWNFGIRSCRILASAHYIEGVGDTAWPLLNGLISRKANDFSLSRSFMDGISPRPAVKNAKSNYGAGSTSDNFAKYACSHSQCNINVVQMERRKCITLSRD